MRHRGGRGRGPPLGVAGGEDAAGAMVVRKGPQCSSPRGVGWRGASGLGLPTASRLSPLGCRKNPITPSLWSRCEA